MGHIDVTSRKYQILSTREVRPSGLAALNDFASEAGDENFKTCEKAAIVLLYAFVFPQIAGSYRGSNFSKGGIVFANWPTSGCCSECCAGCCPGCCCGCCPGCSGSCLPLGGVRVLSRVLCRGAVQGAPDHVCHWVVSGCCPGCCPGCSGSCLPLGGVRVLCRVLSRVLFRVLRIMFAIGRCQGAVQVLCRGAVQGAPDHVCHWAVSGCCPGCCPGCSGSCLPWGGAVQGAVQGCC